MSPVDFRLQPCLFHHPKWLRLLHELGSEAGISLLRLWGFAAESRPTGALEGLAVPDIAIAAGWSGDNDKFVEALVRLRWLDRGADTYSIHDWPQHQPWLIGAPARAEHARRMSKARWGHPPEQPAKHNGSAENSNPPKAKKDSRTRRHSWPESFLLTEEMKQFASLHHVDPDREFEQFRNHALANGRTLSDWRHGWMNWVLKAEGFSHNGKAKNGASPRILPTLDQLDARDRTTAVGKQE